jgi:hypothetical protein
MKYKCIRSFIVSRFNDYGFETGKYLHVKIDTIWELDDSHKIIGGQNHLDNNSSWLEISDETLKSDFVEVNVKVLSIQKIITANHVDKQ